MVPVFTYVTYLLPSCTLAKSHISHISHISEHRHHRLNYFAAGVYQIGDDQARSWSVNGIPSGIGSPLFTES